MRKLILSFSIGLFIFGLLGAAHPTTAHQTADRPNIVFIVADDLGYADLGSYGQRRIETPHLDRMATQGMRFTDVYSGSTVCAPARSVLMTGQHTGHTTVRGNFGREGEGAVRGIGSGSALRVPLFEEDTTVAEVLQEAGYVTGMTGKWGLGEPNTSGEPNRQGFDEWFGFLNQNRAHTYYPEFIWHNRERFDLPNEEGTRRLYVHDLFTDFALHFIRRHRDEPFFLYLAYQIPHSELKVPELGHYAEKDWPEPAKLYAAMVSRLDRDVGRIIALLQELGIDQNTIVFFTSDNGPHSSDGNDPEFFKSSGPLQGIKRDLYEGGIRVPMIVRWPGCVPAGEVSDLPWYFADVLPTLADLVGVDTPAHVDGVSVKPTLLGESQDLTDRFLYWEFYERGFQQAARWQNWKAIRLTPDEPIELYNLQEDIGETNNVADEYPEVIERFERYLREDRRPSANWPSPLD
jgi:arylsulfatase A-like enzyme